MVLGLLSSSSCLAITNKTSHVRLFVLYIPPDFEGIFLVTQQRWQTDTTSTVSLSISSPNTSARDTLTPANGNGWSTSTETPTAPTWDILTFSTTSLWPRMRAKPASASIWWRRCFSHVDHQWTNLMMPNFFHHCFKVMFHFLTIAIELQTKPNLFFLFFFLWNYLIKAVIALFFLRQVQCTSLSKYLRIWLIKCTFIQPG